MKSFQCQNCGQLLFFENTQCLQCGYPIGYLPEMGTLSALSAVDEVCWQPLESTLNLFYVRLCQNYYQEYVCNWLVPAESKESYCLACRLNHTIPNLSQENNHELWSRLESAKRRLIYSLLTLGLPVISKAEDPQQGLAFDFLASVEGTEADPVTTGHADGLITINIAEADSVAREQARVAMNEPYRTLLGHFRHEVGHYYWMLLVQQSERLEPFRQLFGDERENYHAAVERHYERGAPTDWQDQYVSSYATMHPWEDWAETWAHYLHITDTIETAQEFGIIVRLQPQTDQSETIRPTINELYSRPFEDIIEQWLPLTYALNSINRSLGQPDMYPFVLSPKAIKKLEFVHEIISRARPKKLF